jgi:hypothetical protein
MGKHCLFRSRERDFSRLLFLLNIGKLEAGL